MGIKNSKKIRNVTFSTTEGAFYGLLLGIFIWGVFYSMWELQGYYRNTDTSTGINIDRAPLPIDILNICLMLIFTVSILKFVQTIYYGFTETSIKNWMKTGICAFVGLYLIVFIIELYHFLDFGYGFYESKNLALWILILILILIFSVFYAVMKNYLFSYKK